MDAKEEMTDCSVGEAREQDVFGLAREFEMLRGWGVSGEAEWLSCRARGSVLYY